jgi:hypothetical protein
VSIYPTWRNGKQHGPYFVALFEAGSGAERVRVKRYLGKAGARELRSGIRALCFKSLGHPSPQEARRAEAKEFAEMMKLARQLSAQEARQAIAARNAALGLLGCRAHGHTVRQRRDVPAEARWAAEYRLIPREALEEASWPGITEEEWVGLRRAVMAEQKRRSRLKLHYS